MTIMTKILWALSGEYVLIAIGFALAKDWPRCLYFASATAINFAVLFMR